MAEKKNLKYRILEDEVENADLHFRAFKRHPYVFWPPEQYPQKKYPLHWHNYIEMELVIQGGGMQTINGTEVKLSPGLFTIMRLTDYHEVIPEPHLEVYNLSFDEKLLSPETINTLTSAKGNLAFELTADEFDTLQQFCRFCEKESKLPQPDLHYIKHLLEAICIQIFRRPDFKTGKQLATNEDSPIHRVLLYMHAHFREDPSLNQLAEIAHYSPNYFSTVFHKQMGTTYLEYLNGLKIKYSKQLLLSTQLKSIDIAFQCGFNSFNSFLRTFKSYTGTTPMEYKKSKERKQQAETDQEP